MTDKLRDYGHWACFRRSEGVKNGCARNGFYVCSDFKKERIFWIFSCIPLRQNWHVPLRVVFPQVRALG